MSQLALVRLAPDLDGLARAAAAHGLLGSGGDFGYALHAALAAAFGNMAPKPFLLRSEIGRPEVLGYTRADPAELRELARLHRSTGPIWSSRYASAKSRCEHSLRIGPPGRSLDFETRVRPVVRTRPQGRDGPTRERDAFLETLDDREPPPKEALPHRVWPLREEAYAKWLAREFARGSAAQLKVARLVTFRRTRGAAPPYPAGGGSPSRRKRRARCDPARSPPNREWCQFRRVAWPWPRTASCVRFRHAAADAARPARSREIAPCYSAGSVSIPLVCRTRSVTDWFTSIAAG